MISLFFPNPNKVVPKSYPVAPSFYEQKKADERNISVAEYKRRCSLVRDAARNTLTGCLKGTKLEPIDSVDMEIWGECTLEKVLWCYDDFGLEEQWPTGDNPRVVVAFSEKTNKTIFATNNFFRRINVK